VSSLHLQSLARGREALATGRYAEADETFAGLLERMQLMPEARFGAALAKPWRERLVPSDPALRFRLRKKVRIWKDRILRRLRT
jgi:hypothetical protein